MFISGMCESLLEAKMSFCCLLRGADRFSFPPVVASGANANVIHYIRNDNVLKVNYDVVTYGVPQRESRYRFTITPVASRKYAKSCLCAHLTMFLCKNLTERAHAQLSTRAGTFFRALSKVTGLIVTKTLFHRDGNCLHCRGR